jgi:predicted GH43/DUF377 family glycosyl hydrolase
MMEAYMKNKTAQVLLAIVLTVWLAACASPEETANSAQSTAVLATPTEEAAQLAFDYTVHSSRTDPALERRTGVTWEGGYVWTPFVVYEEGTFNLFYNGYSTETRGIGLATSTDGIEFIRASEDPVLDSTEEGRVIFSPVIYLDEDGTWVMFIINDEARSGLAGDRVMRYQANDPAGPWELSNAGQPVYEAPDAEHWTANMVIRSVVVEEDQILLGFDARHDDTISIGILRSQDGFDFELLSEEPVLTHGADDSWEADAVSAPMLFQTDSGYEMFYMGFIRNSSGRYVGFEGFNLWLGYAISEDGITWEKHADNPIMNIEQEQGTAYISAMKVDETYYIYYVYGQGAFGIGAATLTRTSP